MHSYMPPLFKRNSNRITSVQKSRSPTLPDALLLLHLPSPLQLLTMFSPMIWWKGLTKWPVKGASVMKKNQVAGLSGKEPTQCGGLGRCVRKQCLDWDECKSPALRHPETEPSKCMALIVQKLKEKGNKHTSLTRKALLAEKGDSPRSQESSEHWAISNEFLDYEAGKWPD